MSIKYLYRDWFGKDRPLRHYTQHLIVGMAVFLAFSAGLGMWSAELLLLLVIGTYVIDLDPLVFFFSHAHRLGFGKDLLVAIKKGNIKEMAIIATKHHKQMQGLYLHNFIGGTIVFIIFLVFFFQGDLRMTFFLAGVIGHLVYDIFDDLYQLGHVENWMVYIRGIFRFFRSIVEHNKEQGKVSNLTLLYKMLGIFAVVARLLLVFFIYLDPFLVSIVLALLDMLDAIPWRYGRLFTKKQYQYVDKFLDYYHITALFLFSLQWAYWPLTVLYLWRTIGDLAVFFTKQRKWFVVFGNYFEPMFHIFSLGIVYIPAVLTFSLNNPALLVILVVILKTPFELYINYFEVENTFYRLGLTKVRYSEEWNS